MHREPEQHHHEPANELEPAWSAWIVAQRAAIGRALAGASPGALPPAGAPEMEALRRFRSFAAAQLRRADERAPALDGLRVDAAATGRLIDAWCRAAQGVAGAHGGALAARLAPLATRFRGALVRSELAHEARRAPRPQRRAVTGAIDRIADAFLAIDLDDGSIADANPAAVALLRSPREALLGRAAIEWVAPRSHAAWSAALEALAESAAPHRFRAVLVDARGDTIELEWQATRFASRARVLALLVGRVPPA